MKVAYQTDVGHQRSQNQDRVSQCPDNRGNQLVVFAVGFGVKRCGFVAAELTVTRLGHRFIEDGPETPLEAIRCFAREVQLIND